MSLVSTSSVHLWAKSIDGSFTLEDTVLSEALRALFLKRGTSEDEFGFMLANFTAHSQNRDNTRLLELTLERLHINDILEVVNAFMFSVVNSSHKLQ